MSEPVSRLGQLLRDKLIETAPKNIDTGPAFYKAEIYVCKQFEESYTEYLVYSQSLIVLQAALFVQMTRISTKWEPRGENAYQYETEHCMYYASIEKLELI